MMEAVAVPLFSILLYITSLFAPADVTEITLTVGDSPITFTKTEEGKWLTILPIDDAARREVTYWVADGKFHRQVAQKVETFIVSRYLDLPFDKQASAFTIKADRQTISVEKGDGYLIFRPANDPKAPPIKATWKTAQDTD